MAKTIMIQGTMSNVGKSLLTAGLCRIFKQDGFCPAPFKSQNMALNSFITDEGLEMGRAQVVQAEAAGIDPCVDMNPILLKPTTDVGSQVIVRGRSIGNMKAAEYFSFKRSLIPQIMESFQSLSSRHHVVVIEGAGSPAEINLKQEDIVNMGMAAMVNAPVLLAADIDRGGVFAQLYGTVMLLEPEERARIKGLIINKFRGDRQILEPGIRMIEELCQIPVVGVVPYMDVEIEDEDSLGSHLQGSRIPGLVNIVVIRLPRISNFTDFDVLSEHPYVTLTYADQVKKLGTPDFIILPGTKSTIEDLLWLRQSGHEAAILKLSQKGVPVFGICGGYQMMGQWILDEEQVETQGALGQVRGMGLLPGTTRFETSKETTRVRGHFGRLDGVLCPLSGLELEGYEIHQGRTKREGGEPFAALEEYQADSHRKKEDGGCLGQIYGTYVHGVFDGLKVADTLVTALLDHKGIRPEKIEHMDRKAFKEIQYDKLADTLRNSLRMDEIYNILENGMD